MSRTGDAERLSAPRSEGLSLEALIGASHRLDELSTARVIGEAAEAVHKAQKGGQALGALSPAAIVVSAAGGVAVEPGASAVGYTAPERLRGSQGDRRSDVFSLGVLLWEALAHERLFDGASEDAIRAAVLGGELRPPSACNANVPAELDAICKKALARDPVDRYQSAKVMAAELAAVLDDAGYPESNEEIARYMAARLASAKPAPAEEARAKAPTVPPAVVAEGPRAKSPTVPPAEPRAKSPTAEPRAKSPTAEPRAKSPTAEPRAKSPTPSSLPSWAHARPAQEARPEPKPTPAPPLVPAAPIVPAGAEPSGKVSPAAATPALAEPSPVAFALGPIPGGTVEPSSPPKLAVIGPGAQTQILGSLGGSAEPAPAQPAPVAAQPAPVAAQPAPVAAQPAPGEGDKPTEPSGPLLGSDSASDAAKLASVQWHDALMPIPQTPPTPISQAETLATPALGGEPGPVEPSQAETASQPPTEPRPSHAAEIPAAGALPASDDDFVEPKHTPHPASAVALPRARSRTDTSKPDAAKGDMLDNWEWGTDSHEAYEDDAYEDTSRTSRKRLFMAIGGAAGAILLITVIAIAAGGGKSKGDEAAKPSELAAKAWNDTPPTPAPDPAATVPPAPEPAPAPSGAAAEPAPAPPPSPEPAAASEPPKPEPPKPEPPKPEPAAVAVAVAEPVKAEPPKPEPPKPAPPKAEPPKPEPAKLAPPKAEPPKLAAKPEPKKPEPPKVAAKPEPPKVAAKPEPPKPAAKPDAKKPNINAIARKLESKPAAAGAAPIDPYAAEAKKPDPSAAYRTGLQQFARGDNNGALATFKASLTASPTFAPTWRGIGLVYEKLGRKGQAKTAFQRYLELAPGAVDAAQIRERLEKL